MSDETPQDIRSELPPVRMALRVVGRHGAGRAGGRHLARSVVAARAPKHLAASTRLAPHPQAEPGFAPAPMTGPAAHFQAPASVPAPSPFAGVAFPAMPPALSPEPADAGVPGRPRAPAPASAAAPAPASVRRWRATASRAPTPRG